MNEQDSTQTQQLNPLSLAEQEQILQNRKRAVMGIIERMSGTLPPMVQTMMTMYRGTVHQFVDNLTYEQTENLINEVQGIIDELRG